MKTANLVMFSLSLSLLTATGGAMTPRDVPQTGTAREPGGPLGAAATLVKVIEQDGRSRALVRLNFDPVDLTGDAETLVSDASPPPGRAAAPAIARTTLHGGRAQSLLVQSDLEPGRLNHLYYKVQARGREGLPIETVLYLSVNLDDSLEPRSADGTLEYMAAPAGEVAP